MKIDQHDPCEKTDSKNKPKNTGKTNVDVSPREEKKHEAN
jgi:hypothetical protein